MSQDIIVLSERIKELTHSTGTGNLNLDGAVAGFSAFGDYYSYNDAIYYAVTDGTDYEVGSGQYILDGSDNALTRFPSQSTNSDGLVNFSAGVKEVYVTYPGKFSVYSASGLSGFDQPQASGLAFWGSPNIVDYDSDLIWDKTNSRMGVGESSPQYALHVGGQESYSQVYSSGSIVGDSGVLFAGIDPAYSGGRQLEPFIRSELNTDTGTNDVFALSGLVDQVLLFKTQTAGKVLAGPPSGCTPGSGCPDDYPVFRALVADDIPDLYSLYVTPVSGWADSTMTARDAAISGWVEAYVDSQDHTAAAVSGWSVDTFLSGGSPEFVYVSGVAEYASGLFNSDSTITVSGVQANSFQLLSGGYVTVAESGYTLSNTDNGKVLLFSHNSGILLTVASGLDFGLATSFIQLGSGQIEVSGAAGVTIYNSQSHTRTNTQHSRAGLMHYAQDVYNFAGDTAT